MNRNVLIVLAGGFLIAVLVALLVQASLSGGKKEAPVVVTEEEKVKIIVATKPIAVGEELTEENVEWRSWPKSAIFPGAVVQEEKKKPLEMLSGRVRRPIVEGEPVVDSALVPKDVNFLAANLEPGMRAVSFGVKASTMVAGFVGPGDYVDILMTYRQKIDYEGEDNPAIDNMIEMYIDDTATETIMQNVKVLAVDQSASRMGEDGIKIKVGKTVTVEVDYKGAEILALAADVGDLSLALRRLGDESIVFEKPPITTDARITNIYDEVLREIVEASGQDYTGQSSKVVRIYRGEAVEEISVRP